MTKRTLNWYGLGTLVTLWVILMGFALTAGVPKTPSDKQRIAQLDQAVISLTKQLAEVKAQVDFQHDDLAGEHKWATSINDSMEVLDQRTLDLHSRVSRLENRGPVANYSPQDPR